MGKWITRNKEEAVLTISLIVIGIVLVIVSHIEHLAHPWVLAKELAKEIGFACLVACAIKYLNERFLRRELAESFELHRKKIAEDVLKSVFDRLIPKPLFNELRRTVFGGLRFMRDRYKVTYDFFERPDGLLQVTQYMEFRVQNVQEIQTTYPCCWGINKETKWDRTDLKAYYNYDGGNESTEIVIPLDKPHSANRFGDEHDEFRYEIPFPKHHNRLIVKMFITHVYHDPTLTGDSLLHFFLIPTSNVSVNIRNQPKWMKLKLWDFSGDRFQAIEHPEPDKHRWVHPGCFYPNQGYVLEWEREKDDNMIRA